MNKTELASAVEAKTSLNKKQSEEAVSAVLASITDALAEGEKVALVGFGTFAVSKRSATTGRNPRTGQSIKIPARNQPKFRAGKVLVDSVN